MNTHFPIQIDGKQVYTNNVCTSDFSNAIMHQSFLTFHTKNRNFLYAKDSHENLTFNSSLIHHTLNQIKQLEPKKIAEYTGSTSFIVYAILIVTVLVLSLFICFCPAVFISILFSYFYLFNQIFYHNHIISLQMFLIYL